MTDRYSETELIDFYDFFVNAPIALHVVDRDGVVRMANEAALRMTGHGDGGGGHAGRPLAELHADPAVVDRMLDHGSRGESHFSARTALRRRDGGEQPIVIHANARLRDGELAGTRCVAFADTADPLARDVPHPARDVEELANAMSPAERQELFETLEDFFENAPVALHIVGPDGLIRRANRLELENLGYIDRPEEYLGHHIAEFHADQAVIDEMLERLVGGRPLVHYRARLIRRGGDTMPVVIYSSPRLDRGSFVNTRCFTFPSTVDAPAAAPSYSWPRNDADAGLGAGDGNPLTVALRRLAGRKSAEESLGFLSEVGKTLAASDYAAGVAAACSLAVPFLADWCSAEAGAGGETRTLGTARGCIAGSDQLIRAFAHGEARNVAGYHALRIPLATADGGAGDVLLVRDGDREDFGPADRALAEEFARRVTLAVELGRLREMLASPQGTREPSAALLRAGRS